MDNTQRISIPIQQQNRGITKISFTLTAILILASFGLNLQFTTALPSCFTYPIGTGGYNNDIEFDVLDIDSKSDNVVVGGSCKDQNICTSGQVPIIQLYPVVSVSSYLWSVYISTSSGWSTVFAVKFRPDGTKVAVATTISSGLTISVLSATNGSLLFSYSDSLMNGKLNSQSILIDNNDALTIGSTTSSNQWSLIQIPMPASSSSTIVVSNFKLIVNASSPVVQNSYISSIIFDSIDWNITAGFLIQSGFQFWNGRTQGGYLIHVNSSGLQDWSLLPSTIAATTNNQKSSSYWQYYQMVSQSLVQYNGKTYYWTCGAVQSYSNQVSQVAGAIATLQLQSDMTLVPDTSTFKVMSHPNSYNCLAIQGMSDQLGYAFALGNQKESLILKINFSLGNFQIYQYNKLDSDYTKYGSIDMAMFSSNGFFFFVGSLTKFDTQTFIPKVGYLSKMIANEAVTYQGETCTSYTLTYNTTNTSATSNLQVTAQKVPLTFITIDSARSLKVLTYTAVKTKSQGLVSIICSSLSSQLAPTITPQSWDYGLQTGSREVTFPEFSTSVCSGGTFNYSATFTPAWNQGQIVFPSNTTSPRTFDFSKASNTSFYTVKLTGTLDQSSFNVSTTFTVNITNSFNSALVSITLQSTTSSTTLEYIIGNPSTYDSFNFTASNSASTTLNSLQFSTGNGTGGTWISTNQFITINSKNSASFKLQIGNRTLSNSLLNGQMSVTYYVYGIFNVNSNPSSQLVSSNSIQVRVRDQCYPTTVTVNTAAMNNYYYTVLDPSIKYNFDPFIVTQPGSLINCVTYTYLYLQASSGQVVTFTNMPLLTLNEASLTISYAAAGSIGTKATSLYQLQINAFVAAQSMNYSWPLNVTINNECLNATLQRGQNYPSSPGGDLFNYTLTNTSVSYNVTQFATSQTPGASCFKYQLYNLTSNNVALTPNYLNFSYPTAILKAPTSGLIGATQNTILQYIVRGSINIDNGMTVDQDLTFDISLECSSVLIVPTTQPFNISYINLSGNKSANIDLFTYTQANATQTVKCLDYSLIDSSTKIYPVTPTNLEVYFDPAALNLTIYSITPNITGNQKLLTFTWIIIAQSTGSLPAYQSNSSFQVVVYHECYNQQLSGPTQNQSLQYVIGDPQSTYFFQNFTNSSCQVDYSLIVNGSHLQSNSSLFFFDPTLLKLMVLKQTNLSSIGVYNLTLSGAVRMGVSTLMINYLVDVYCCIQALNPSSSDVDLGGGSNTTMATQSYTIGSGLMAIPFHQFVPTFDCQLSVNYTFVLDIGTPLPSFIVPSVIQGSQGGGGSLSIDLKQRLGLYQFSFIVLITGSSDLYNGHLSQMNVTNSTLAVPIVLVVVNKGPPQFLSALLTYQVQVSKALIIKLPGMTDPDPDDSASVHSLSWGNCQSFVTGTYPTFLVSPAHNDTDPGECDVTVVLQDNNPNPLSSTHSFKVTVTPLPPAIAQIPDTIEIGNFQPTKKTQAAVIQKVLGFFRSSMDQNSEISIQLNVSTPLVYSMNNSTLALWLVNSATNKKVKSLNYTFNSKQSSLSEIVIDLIEFNVDFSTDYNILATVSESLEITQGQTKYELKAGTKIVTQVPHQITQSQQKALDVATKGTTYLSYAMASGMAAMSIVISGALPLIWGMLHAISQLSMLSLISVKIPGITRMINQQAMQASQLGFLKPDSIISKTFKFDDADQVSLNQYFQEFGFKSMNCIRNMGPTFIFIMVLILALVFTLALQLSAFKTQRFQTLQAKLSKAFFWGVTIRLIIQQQPKLLLSIIIQLYMMEFNMSGESFASIFALVAIIICLSMPVIIYKIIRRAPELQDESFVSKFGTLLLDLNLNSKSSVAKYWSAISLAMMQIKIILLILLRDYPGFVITLLYMQSVFIQALIIAVKPFQFNNLELFNELLVSAYLLTTILLSDYDISDQNKSTSALVILFILGSAVLANLSKVFYQLFFKLRLAWRQRKQAKEIERQKKYPVVVQELKELKEDYLSVTNLDHDISSNNINDQTEHPNQSQVLEMDDSQYPKKIDPEETKSQPPQYEHILPREKGFIPKNQILAQHLKKYY